MNGLVSTEWLAAHLDDPELRIVDATHCLPDAGRNERAEFEAAHIPGAVFLDLSQIRDTDSALPIMLPSTETFATTMQSLGIGDGTRVVLYDNAPHKTAARAWFMLKTFGVKDISILDGGFTKWQAEGRPLESGKPVPHPRHFTPWTDRSQVRDLDQMKGNLTTGAEQVVDARGAAGFEQGHIPGSLCLGFDCLFNADGTWKQGEALRQAFVEAGVDLKKPMVTTCGGGVTAAVVMFGAQLLGKHDVALYDGSWSEWGADPSTPKATGPA